MTDGLWLESFVLLNMGNYPPRKVRWIGICHNEYIYIVQMVKVDRSGGSILLVPLLKSFKVPVFVLVP